MQKLKTFLTVFGAVTVLVLAANTVAYAATGGKFILGHVNKANKQTTLKRTTSGSALGLVTKSSSNAPLVTNGRGKVANLNADMVDGLDSTALKNNVRVFTVSIPAASPVTDITKELPLAAGTYSISWSGFFVGAEGGFVNCYLRSHSPLPTDTTLFYTADSGFDAGTSIPSLSATGLVTQSATSLNQFVCSATNAFNTTTVEPIQIVVTKVDSVLSNSALRTAPGGSARRTK
jgi:hypothetical protein